MNESVTDLGFVLLNPCPCKGERFLGSGESAISPTLVKNHDDGSGGERDDRRRFRNGRDHETAYPLSLYLHPNFRHD